MILLPRIIILGVLLGTALAGQVGLRWYFESPELPPPKDLLKPLAGFPRQLGDWRGVDRPDADDEPLYGEDEHLDRDYQHLRRGQVVALWISYSQKGLDRGHNPEVCMVVAGKPEIREARQTLRLEGPGGPAQQYLYGRVGDRQRIFYWHYTMPTRFDPRLSGLQRHYQKVRRKPASVTLEVFAPEYSSEDAEFARQFVGLVDAAVRDHVGPTASRGSWRLPVIYVDPDE